MDQARGSRAVDRFSDSQRQPGLPEGHRSIHPTRSGAVARFNLGTVDDLIYRRRHGLRLTGLALLAAGLAIAIGVDSAAGLAVVGLGALVLLVVQPLILARARARAARRRAPRNGHGPGADAQDVDLPSP
jgi:hypothetical protein